MSGRYAVNAATHFPQVHRRASVYGTHLATDQPDSPHLLRPRQGRTCIRLRRDRYLRTCRNHREVREGMKGSNNEVEIYPGTHHGSPFRSGRSMTATPPSGIGNGCVASIAATSPKSGTRCPSSPSPFRCSTQSRFDRAARDPLVRAGYIGGIVLVWLTRGAGQERTAVGGRRRSRWCSFDDFILWGHDRLIVGGRTGYVLFYQSRFLVQHRRNLELWNGGMSFHGGFLGCVAAVMLFCRQMAFPILRSATSPRVGQIALAAGGSPTHQQRAVGRAADASVPWAMVFPNGGPLARPPASCIRPGLRASCCLRSWRSMIQMGALKRPG